MTDRKSQNVVPVSLRVPTDLYDGLQKRSEQMGNVSVSAVIRMAIQRYLEPAAKTETPPTDTETV